MSPPVALDAASIEAVAQRVNALALDNLSEMGLDNLAERVAEHLSLPGAPSRDRTAPRLVDARELAAQLRVSRDTIYAHAQDLGGQRIGSGPRGRLRFDLDRALAAWTARSESKESARPRTPVSTGNAGRRRRSRLGSSPQLLPIRGSATRGQSNRERT